MLFQIVVGVLIIALSTSLSVRWEKLTDRCGDSTSKECFKIRDGLGGVQFSIAPGAFALLDVLIFATDEFWYSLPWWLVCGSAQLCGGMALGGGCVRYPGQMEVRISKLTLRRRWLL